MTEVERASKALGLTKKELAIRSGIHYGIVWQMEHGERPYPGIRFYRKVAATLGVHVFSIIPDDYRSEFLEEKT